MTGIIERCGLWLRGDDSYSSGLEIDVDEMTAIVNKTYSTIGQNKDNGNKTMMGMKVDFSNIPLKTIYIGFLEYWVINWFRKIAKVNSLTVEGLVDTYQGKTIMAEDFEPVGGKRGPVDPVKAVTNNFAKLDEATKRAIIAKMQAELDAEEETN